MSRVVAMNYEMVSSGNQKILAQVTIVDEDGSVVLDEYVKPTAPVTDYSGKVYIFPVVEKHHLENGSDFSVVRNKVANIINGRILVGHSLQIFLEALNLSHPESERRDLDKFEDYIDSCRQRRLPRGRLPTDIMIDIIFIEKGFPFYKSAEYAKTCMDMYRKYPNYFKAIKKC